MKILIVGSIQGDGSYEEEALCLALKEELLDQNHTVDCFFLPYERNILALPEQILAYQLLQVGHCDCLITIGYPACMLKHHNKVSYLLQMEPMLGEYWDSAYGILANRQYSDLLQWVWKTERQALGEARKVLTVSKLLAKDLNERYGLTCQTAVYPPLECEAKENEEPGGYVLCESSLLPWQRAERIVEVAVLQPDCRIHLHVPNAMKDYVEYIQNLIQEKHVEQQVKLIFARVGIQDMKQACGVFLPDYQIRRIPNIALCGMKNKKPVIAIHDGGALTEIVPVDNCIEMCDLPQLLKRMKREDTGLSEMVSWERFTKELLNS